MKNKKFKISQENYELLTKMIDLTEKRSTVQGEFWFNSFNDKINGKSEKEGILNCGTSGCLAGGYLPLLDKERFYFDEIGDFRDYTFYFEYGKFSKELGDKLFSALFFPHYQERIGLENLIETSTLKEVVENAKKVLELCEIEN